MSWESTASYYRLLNEMTAAIAGPWEQPRLLIDSVNFADVVALQHEGDWVATGELLAASARRLEAAGADVLAICANTMHRNAEEVRDAVRIPLVDIRDALATQIAGLGARSVALLGTRYLWSDSSYDRRLEQLGLRVVKPTASQAEELHTIIYDELTRGRIETRSRDRFMEIASDCRERGGDVVGLCCTEFGLLVDAETAPWPCVDSTVAHVRALLQV